MGVESNRVPPLPPPTETESTTPTELLTDLATDVSIKNADDKSSYLLPEDGTPVTIKARGRQRSKSQTSLLIEYFEHSKAGSSAERKPSVRVRLTPSSKSRENDHHIQITKTKSSRKATASRRIPLSPTENGSEIYDFDDGKSMSSYASATEESNVSRQIEVDIDRNFHTNRRQRRPASPLIPAAGVAGTESRTGSFMQSEVSAIPTDSFLDGTSGQSKSSGSPYLPAEKMREKSSGRERPVVTAPRPKERDKEKKHKSSKSRSTSVSRDYPEVTKSRRPSRSHHQDSILSGADSSVLSSQMSESMRSGTSKASSINNPKLLETVEDAIRRLILPELNALKREQSKRGSRPESLTASTVTSVASTEDVRQKRRTAKSTDSRDTARHHESRNREARNDLEDTPRDFERESIDDSVLHENEYDSPKLSNDKLKVAAAAAAAAAAVGAASSLAPSLAPSALSEQTSSEVSSRRRRRSAKKSSRGTEDKHGEFEGGLAPPVPPMPLSSEINASDITRTSILSAPTDSPHSATEEVTPVQQISRGVPAVDDDTPGPLRTPSTLDQLGAHHANVSRGDLRDLPKQRTGEFPKGIEGPVEQEEYEEEEDYDNANPYSGLYTQDVPAPLNYVPYQPASRGLSPIESVSGYTDGHSEIQPHQRDSRLTTTTGSFSPTKSPGPHMDEAISNLSAPSNIRTHDFDDRSSLRSSALGYRNTTYTEDSEVDRVQSGQAVQLLGANPNYVNSPVGVESNVASLVDGSAVDASLLSYGYHQQQSGSNHDSVVSLDERRSAAEGRGISPGSPSVASRRQLFEDRMDSPLSRKSNLSHEYQEYEPDQYGRKVPISTTTYRQSPTPSETAIADAAVAALKQKAKQKDMSNTEFVGEGVSRNKSFKERVKTREPAPEPKHSVDRFSFDESPRMRATGLPDFHDPLPEIGYGADDHSVVEGPLGGDAASTHSWQDHNRSANATPTQKSMHSISQQELAPRDIVTPVAAGALAGAAAAGLTPRSHARSQDIDDDFVQTSADRKRDTLLTNPYENASPIAVLPGMNPLGPEQYGAPPPFPSGTPLQGKVDEGYISQGPNRTPDLRNKGKSVEAMDPASYGPVDDPFGGQSQMRHMSGLSQGMASPFYDAATGTGIDRIENKDIVALMQHLMVRDAERSARDTEILVSLVRTAADMRNSFNVVTQMLSDVENTIISEVQENTEKTVKTHISGPRPYPGSATRSIHGGSQSGAVDEATARKRNFLKKALKGLTMKGSSDLGRIEDMLMHLLSEVDVLKTQTAGARQAGQSFEHLPQPEVQYEHDRGYEPEGIAGTSTASHASQSGPLSVPQRGPSAKLGYDRRFPAEGNRISTVPEEDDYESQHLGTPRHATPTQQHYSNPNMLMSPTHETRGSSVPLDTPPQPATHTGSMSQEQTPNTPKDKKKHKSSGSSSWFPKISRWSETTASSVGNKLRISGSSKKNQSDDFLQHPPSRSGSALDQYDADGFLRTEPFGDDKLQMQTGYSDPDLAGHHSPSLQRGSPGLQAPHPATFMTPEDPKYKAHRNSINLMHPQPRQGNTERFKMNLETKAQDFDSPLSPKSADWAGSATSLNRFPENPNHYADGSAAASAAQEYWGPDSTTSAGPPRPPKEPIDDSPTSTRLSKVNKESSPLPFHSVESGYGTATTGAFASPRLENRHLSAAQGVPTRRPSGPRAMTPRGDDERRKRDTFGTVASQESETF